MLYFFFHVASSLFFSCPFFSQVVLGLAATRTELKFETEEWEPNLPVMRDIPVCVCLSPAAVPSTLLTLSRHPFEL